MMEPTFDPAAVLVADAGAGCGATLLHLPVATSTQDVARELAQLGAPAGTAVLAEQQTAGRGTRGRSWQSATGAGLWLSVLTPVPEKPEAVPWLTPAAAIAVTQTLRGLTTVPPCLKWPNDVLLGGRKVAGVLTEVPGGGTLAIVGIGLNVRAAPDDELRYPATYVDAWTPHSVSREEIAGRLLRELDYLLARLRRGKIDHVKEAWRMLLATLGARVSVEEDGRVTTGRALTVDGTGALIVKTDGGATLRLAAGSDALLRHLDTAPQWPVGIGGREQ